MPAINRHGVAGLAVVLRYHGRKLLQRHMCREALPLVVKPGLGEKRIVVARAHRVIPLPRGQFAALWLSVHQHLRHAFRVSLRLLEHRELIGVHRLIFMDRRLDVPACKVPAIAARERARPQPSHRNTLPVAVIDVARRPRLTRVLERQTRGRFQAASGIFACPQAAIPLAPTAVAHNSTIIDLRLQNCTNDLFTMHPVIAFVSDRCRFYRVRH